jgi:hypothetical protein
MIYPETIPNDLKQYAHWVCWRYEENGGSKPTKVPCNPITGYHAATNKPTSWTDFDTALSNVGRFDGLGFVLTDSDPFVFIDLDDTKGDEKALISQKRIFDEFNSYTEISPSGNGVHILVKGSIPSGRKRSQVEVYSNGRFMTVTGNLYKNKPIEDRNELANMLWLRMGGTSTNVVDGESPQTENDDDVMKRALNATNGDKFKQLLDGEWEQLYASQSEADFAFIDIVSFYTQNRNQIMRVFRESPLGQRDKAKRDDYVNYMINRSFDNILPPIDIDGLKLQIDEAVARGRTPTDTDLVPTNPVNQQVEQYTSDRMYSFPPGLVGEIAEYIYGQSPRPVREIALTAAIALMSGIIGRAYNVSRTGLNQYTLLLADTGTGKEAGGSGIARIINAVAAGATPAAKEFLGPSEVASQQALLKFLANKSRSFVSVVGEYGLQLKQMSADNGNPNAVGLRRTLLNLYNKSGHGDQMGEMIYSNKDNSTEIVLSPAFSLYGESTAGSFYGSMDESSVVDGLLPRFTIIEYNGPRVELVEVGDKSIVPDNLINKVSALCGGCLDLNHNNHVNNVLFTPEAQEFSNNYNKHVDQIMNSSKNDVMRHLWNRAHLRLLKLAATVAVGINRLEPVIDIHCMMWAAPIVTRSIETILARFSTGDVGNDMGRNSNNLETGQMKEVIRVIQELYYNGTSHAKKYALNEAMLKDRVIPYIYLQRRLSSCGVFKNDRSGATNAIKRNIQTMLDSDMIRELGKADLATKYNTKGRAFIVSTVAILQP